MDAYINANINVTYWMTIETKEPSDPKGLHFVFKHTYLKKKLGDPVI